MYVMEKLFTYSKLGARATAVFTKIKNNFNCNKKDILFLAYYINQLL